MIESFVPGTAVVAVAAQYEIGQAESQEANADIEKHQEDTVEKSVLEKEVPIVHH